MNNIPPIEEFVNLMDENSTQATTPHMITPALNSVDTMSNEDSCCDTSCANSSLNAHNRTAASPDPIEARDESLTSHLKPRLNQHAMQIRAKQGIFNPNPKYGLVALSSSNKPTAPKTVKSAIKHPGWRAAMHAKIDVLAENVTWELVPRSPSQNVIGCEWVFKTKLCADGTLDRLKARLVAKDYNQREDVDFYETFSPVIKPGSIRTVLTIATVKHWPIRQLDIKNAFLHGYLHEAVFMEQPPGFIDSTQPNYVCKLNRALYGLKQAPRAWFDRFSSFLLQYGYFCSIANASLFILRSSAGLLIVICG